MLTDGQGSFVFERGTVFVSLRVVARSDERRSRSNLSCVNKKAAWRRRLEISRSISK